MVSSRCIQTVHTVLSSIEGIRVDQVYLGAAQIKYQSPDLLRLAAEKLKEAGFELVISKDDIILEQIKVSVLEMIYYGNNLNTIIRNSDYLSDKLAHPYVTLSKIFSERTGTTLEKYIIMVRIERVKELLSYNEMTLSEIAYQMGYSSVQYLSNQFKQITGMSVTDYKALPVKPRIPLDRLLDQTNS